MKSLKIYIVILLSSVFLTNCQKDNGGQTQTGGTYDKLSTVVNACGQAAKVFENTLFQFNDTLQAIHAVGNFLAGHDQIKSGNYINRNTIEITFKTGLKSSISFFETDANDNHKYRGGGSSGTLEGFLSQGKTVKIKNEKVLVLNPYINEFSYPNHSYDSYLPYFEGGDVKLTVTHFESKDVRLSHINSMDEYGMVILNTHGSFNSFGLYDLVSLSQPEAESFTPDNVKDLLEKADNYPMEKFENGELEMGAAFIVNNSTQTITIAYSLVVTAAYIRNSTLDLTDVVVFGNYCYSGFKSPFKPDDNMVEAMRSKNAGTYYAYAFDNGMSAPANDEFCRQVEISLIKRLAQDNDTTGIAHLSAQNNPQGQTVYADSVIFGMDISEEQDWDKFQRMLQRNHGSIIYPLYLTKFFSGNLKWGCEDTTFTDPRDGEVYKVVCIGNQTWMAENLRYAGAGVCYDNDESNCAIYGRLYSLKEATGEVVSNTNPSGIQGISPPGWHVPSSDEWRELFDASGRDVRKLRDISWQTQHQNTNELGFSALPGGYYVVADTLKEFDDIGEIAHWWTTSYNINLNHSLGVIIATSYGYNYEAGYEPPSAIVKRYFSIRCVKD